MLKSFQDQLLPEPIIRRQTLLFLSLSH